MSRHDMLLTFAAGGAAIWASLWLYYLYLTWVQKRRAKGDRRAGSLLRSSARIRHMGVDEYLHTWRPLYLFSVISSTAFMVVLLIVILSH